MPKQISANDYQKQKDLKKELLTSKINFGIDPTPYDTTYGSEHTAKPYCKDSGKSLEIMKDLRSTHYQFGYMDAPKDSIYGADFKPHGGKPSKLDPALAKDLRSHHGSFGIDALDYGTSYQNSHGWKQPGKEGEGGHCPDCCMLENEGVAPCHPTGKNLHLYHSKQLATAGSTALGNGTQPTPLLAAVRAK